MKKFFTMILFVALVYTCLGCDAGMVGYERDDSAGDLELSLDNNDYMEEVEFQSVSQYMRHYKRVEGSIVTITGLLGDGYIFGYLDDDKLVNIIYDQMSEYDNIPLNSKVYVTGESCIDDQGNPYIDLISMEYVPGLSEPYWSNSTLITDNNILDILSSDVDPNEYFEFSAIINNDYSEFQLIGLDNPSILYRVSTYGINDSIDVYQILITNLRVTNDGIDFDIVELIDLEQ